MNECTSLFNDFKSSHVFFQKIRHYGKIFDFCDISEVQTFFWQKLQPMCEWLLKIGYWTCDFVEAGPIESPRLVVSSWLVSWLPVFLENGSKDFVHILHESSLL